MADWLNSFWNVVGSNKIFEIVILIISIIFGIKQGCGRIGNIIKNTILSFVAINIIILLFFFILFIIGR